MQSIFIISYILTSILVSITIIEVYFILMHNDFYSETFGLKYFIAQLRALYQDNVFLIPFIQNNRKKYTKFGLVFLSFLWIITIGIMLIPASIISFIIWSLRWLFIITCIKR